MHVAGRGGMGEVWQARHLVTRKPYAIKVLRQELVSDETAAARFIQEARVMEAQGSGSIVNVSSIGGLRGSSGMGVYQATKHAVIGLTRTAAHDFGPLGVRVNVLAPGPTESPMLAELRRTIPGGVEARIAATPLRKPGTGAEVGATAAFLLSDRASHISGVVLPVDGGFLA